MSEVRFSGGFQKYLNDRKRGMVPFPWTSMQVKSGGIQPQSLYFVAGDNKSIFATDIAFAFAETNKRVAYVSSGNVPERIKNDSRIVFRQTISFTRLQTFADSASPDLLIVEDLQDFLLTADDVANDQEIIEQCAQCVVPDTIGIRAYTLKRMAEDYHMTVLVTLDMYDVRDPDNVTLDDFYGSIGWVSCTADMVIALRMDYVEPSLCHVFMVNDRNYVSPPYQTTFRLNTSQEHFLDGHHD